MSCILAITNCYVSGQTISHGGPDPTCEPRRLLTLVLDGSCILMHILIEISA